ncbi:MAG: asparagine synthetase B family protein, partial [Thermodesulfobacteriota bacterium]
MCRILGIINYKQSSEKSAECLINSLTDQLAHGGPDDRGVYIDDESRVALGHRRLSIIDLSSSGRQPMPSDDNKIRIIFNGEIYNFPELKEELIRLGHNFKTNTDTEVILKAYIQWGSESFKKFIGMFAFCIYDKKEKKTFLVRDQSGIKPLYYSFKNNELIFSSETKTFIKFNNNWRENKDWKTYFLAYGFIPEPYTYLEDVFMLAKGSYLVFDSISMKFNINQFDTMSFSNTESDLDEITFN